MVSRARRLPLAVAPGTLHELPRPSLEIAADRTGHGDAAGPAAPTRAEPGPLVGQGGVGHGPAVVDLADECLVRHPGIGQEDLVEQGPPGHLPQRPDVDAGLHHGAGEVGDALVLGHAGVGAGQQHAHVGLLPVGGPYLLPVDDPFVAVPDGPGLEPGQIRTGRRLGEELAPRLLTGDDGPDVPVDLGLGPVGGDGGGGEQQAEAVRSPEGAEGADGLGHLDGVVAGEALAVGVGRQRGGRPAGQPQPLPPGPDGQLGVPLGAQPLVELVEDLIGRGGHSGVGHRLPLGGAGSAAVPGQRR